MEPAAADLSIRKLSRRDVVLSVAALVLPFLIVAAWLAIAVPNYRNRGPYSDFIAMLAALLAGAACVAAIPKRRVWRIIIPLLYMPSMAGLLLIFVLCLVCAVFGDCL